MKSRPRPWLTAPHWPLNTLISPCHSEPLLLGGSHTGPSGPITPLPTGQPLCFVIPSGWNFPVADSSFLITPLAADMSPPLGGPPPPPNLNKTLSPHPDLLFLEQECALCRSTACSQSAWTPGPALCFPAVWPWVGHSVWPWVGHSALLGLVFSHVQWRQILLHRDAMWLNVKENAWEQCLAHRQGHWRFCYRYCYGNNLYFLVCVLSPNRNVNCVRDSVRLVYCCVSDGKHIIST